MKKEINKLALKILKGSGIYREYSDKDLMDATLIFIEVFMTKMHDHHKEKLSQKQLERLAEEAGKSIRQTILLFTGVDMHKVLQIKLWRINLLKLLLNMMTRN